MKLLFIIGISSGKFIVNKNELSWSVNVRLGSQNVQFYVYLNTFMELNFNWIIELDNSIYILN